MGERKNTVVFFCSLDICLVANVDVVVEEHAFIIATFFYSKLFP